MKRMLLLVGAVALTTALFGYSVQLTSSPDVTATDGSAVSAGWSKGARTASAASAGDFRQMSFADSAPYRERFDSDARSGLYIIVW